MTEQQAAPAPLRRVFFAIWPDDQTAGALAAMAKTMAPLCGGRVMRRETLHLTLAFIGSVNAEQLAELRRVAAAVTAPAFDLELDRLAWWRHNRIVWAGSSAVPPALQGLARDLSAGLRDAGFRVEDRPFAVHVTLLRNAHNGAEGGQPAAVRWPVHEFLLVESLLQPRGAVYRPLDRYPLQR
ncbi:MAG: RNA 2',3'-cyclic phosphodiesterase [Rhodocyclaceae bacterium]